MKLSANTHDELQRFFRQHLNDETLRLPPITVHCGLVAKLSMKFIGMGAITFGRHILLKPEFLKLDKSGRVTAPGWLLAHEAAHVLQYEQKGFVRFLRDYLRGYLEALSAGKRWDAAGRMAAYLAIAEERVAREAEYAYHESKRVQ